MAREGRTERARGRLGVLRVADRAHDRDTRRTGAGDVRDRVALDAADREPRDPDELRRIADELEAAGLELVRAAAELVRIPWFAIGGIDLATVAAVAAAGARGVAVVRAIRDADDPGAAARALRAAVTPHAA